MELTFRSPKSYDSLLHFSDRGCRPLVYLILFPLCHQWFDIRFEYGIENKLCSCLKGECRIYSLEKRLRVMQPRMQSFPDWRGLFSLEPAPATRLKVMEMTTRARQLSGCIERAG